MAGPPFEWEIVDDVMITWNRPGEVDDKIWSEYLEVLRTSEVVATFSLVDGAITVNATQRKGAADVLREKKLQAVVLIEDRLSRGILTALSWLGANVNGFSWADADKAVASVLTSDDTKAKLAQRAEKFTSRM